MFATLMACDMPNQPQVRGFILNAHMQVGRVKCKIYLPPIFIFQLTLHIDFVITSHQGNRSSNSYCSHVLKYFKSNSAEIVCHNNSVMPEVTVSDVMDGKHPHLQLKDSTVKPT